MRGGGATCHPFLLQQVQNGFDKEMHRVLYGYRYRHQGTTATMAKTLSRHEARQEHAAVLAGHGISERVSRSWHLNALTDAGKYRSAYAYSITWTPGTLVLAGDLGECTITHYRAMPTAFEAAQWVHRADMEYLLGKSTTKQEPDATGTALDIISWCNEEAFHAARSHRGEVRDWHRDAVEAQREYEAAKAVWQADDPDMRGDAPTPEQFGPGERPVAPAVTRCLTGSRYAIGGWFVPEGWAGWYRLHQATGNDHDLPADAIFTAVGRREIKEALKHRLNDNDPSAMAELCREIGFEDYYGRYSYTWHAGLQYAAFQHWAKLVLPSLTATKEQADAPP